MFTIGLDLGQRQDFSAIAVVQRRDERRAYTTSVFHSMALRLIERVPLGTPYPMVVERVREMVDNPALEGQCRVVVDATGVGAPVVDLLRAADLGCEICAVTITGGDKEVANGSARGVTRWSVPKRDLISGVEMLLEKRELRIAKDMKDAGTLIRELMDMQQVTKTNGRVRMGADGCGQHDDLVIALALACWKAQKVTSGYGTVRLQGF